MLVSLSELLPPSERLVALVTIKRHTLPEYHGIAPVDALFRDRNDVTSHGNAELEEKK